MKRTHSFANDDAFLAAVTKVYDDGWSDYDPHLETNVTICRVTNGGSSRQPSSPGDRFLTLGAIQEETRGSYSDLGYRVTGLDVSEQALAAVPGTVSGGSAALR